MSEPVEFEGWAIMELLGHRRLAGFVTVVELAGTPMFRLDVSGEVYAGEETGQATQFIGAGSLYALTPTTEETARAVAAKNRPAPVHAWEFLKVADRAPDQEGNTKIHVPQPWFDYAVGKITGGEALEKIAEARP